MRKSFGLDGYDAFVSIATWKEPSLEIDPNSMAYVHRLEEVVAIAANRVLRTGSLFIHRFYCLIIEKVN
ncbi:hypothetical protein [Cyclobacterium xiamenense]|uniref:hypothetical protein n=1 Tax=Cyclobacterium xiamenense TaxID=1297121 RepID=UPI0035D04237